MFSYDVQQKMIRDYLFNHTKDFGRFYCELMVSSPELYKQFMEGFYDELREFGEDRGKSTKNGI